MRHRVVALCLDGLVAFDLTAPAQAFGLAALPSGDPLYAFTTCSPGGTAVRTTSGFEVTPAAGLGALGGADTVVVPGYAGILRRRRSRRCGRCGAAHRRGARLVSVCTGAFALAHAGALDGLQGDDALGLGGGAGEAVPGGRGRPRRALRRRGRGAYLGRPQRRHRPQPCT